MEQKYKMAIHDKSLGLFV